MTQCQTCGGPLAPGDKFCGDCGGPLLNTAAMPCAVCHFPMHVGARFCIKCGAALHGVHAESGHSESAASEKGPDGVPRVTPSLAGRTSKTGTEKREIADAADTATAQRARVMRNRWPLGVVALGCVLAAGIFWSLTRIDEPRGHADAGDLSGNRRGATALGTLGKTAANADEFSVKQAFTRLYGNYDPNLDGAFWTPTNAQREFVRWNGRALFLRPLISRAFYEDGNVRQLLVTNSLDVKNGDVVKQGTGCRVCESLIGAAIFERHDRDWKLISRHDFLIAGGSWGAPPKVSVSFPGAGEIALQFERRSADPREWGKQSYAILLKERKGKTPELAQTSARTEVRNERLQQRD
ncbi:MAG: zinc ribbon domain-containing protein [Burkholderiales bacterium]